MQQAGYGSEDLQQGSPYTNYESNGDYVKAGYGGRDYEATTAPKEQQPNYYSASAAPLPAPEERKGGMKEKIKGKLAPCLGGHPSPPSSQNAASSPPKKGVLEKVKDKISPRSS